MKNTVELDSIIVEDKHYVSGEEVQEIITDLTNQIEKLEEYCRLNDVCIECGHCNLGPCKCREWEK